MEEKSPETCTNNKLTTQDAPTITKDVYAFEDDNEDLNLDLAGEKGPETGTGNKLTTPDAPTTTKDVYAFEEDNEDLNLDLTEGKSPETGTDNKLTTPDAPTTTKDVYAFEEDNGDVNLDLAGSYLVDTDGYLKKTYPIDIIPSFCYNKKLDHLHEAETCSCGDSEYLNKPTSASSLNRSEEDNSGGSNYIPSDNEDSFDSVNCSSENVTQVP